MNPEQRGRWVTGLLLLAWLVVVAWQVDEHHRVGVAAKTDLEVSSQEIAHTLGAVTRALGYRGAVFQARLDPVLNELVKVRTNALAKSSGLLAVGLLNAEGDLVDAVPNTNLLSRDFLNNREHWSDNYVTFVLPVEGATNNPEGTTNNSNPTVVLPSPPPFRDMTNGEMRGPDFPRNRPFPDETNSSETNGLSANSFPPPPPGGDRPRGENRRQPWIRFGLTEADFRALIARRELHGLVLAMSTDHYRDTCNKDWWLRFFIAFFAGISALGAGLSWRNTARTADLQIRLVRASELNSHLKEMNLAAAGLAHETRNPLNIIRGQSQMLSRLPDAPPEVRAQSKIIMDETDKVTAQLTEFINYSRPREVRRSKIALAAAFGEIVRTLNFDIEEKKIRVETGGDPLAIEADEQLLRQVLFNLLINAIQAVSPGGQIKIQVRRASATEAILEIQDDGQGVAPENRVEIFKPYFTTHQKGTGLGLAVVSQIVLAHGWEIQCLPNDPKGTIFRLTHLKIAA
ncbi:MAG TPA: ATP-binding protein [Verrucomicrobiae bacterium]